MRYFYFLLFSLCTLTYSQTVFADSVPLKGDWIEDDLRSFIPIPFSVEKEGKVLYISSYKTAEDVNVRIVSVTGEVYYEGVYTFFSSDCICLPLDDLSGGEYVIEIISKKRILKGEVAF